MHQIDAPTRAPIRALSGTTSSVPAECTRRNQIDTCEYARYRVENAMQAYEATECAVDRFAMIYTKGELDFGRLQTQLAFDFDQLGSLGQSQGGHGECPRCHLAVL